MHPRFPSVQRSGHPRFVLVQRLTSITPGSLRNEMVWRRCTTTFHVFCTFHYDARAEKMQPQSALLNTATPLYRFHYAKVIEDKLRTEVHHHFILVERSGALTLRSPAVQRLASSHHVYRRCNSTSWVSSRLHPAVGFDNFLCTCVHVL